MTPGTKRNLLIAIITCILIGFVVVNASQLESRTDFSPSRLAFRSGWCLYDVPIFTREWTTPLLDHARSIDHVKPKAQNDWEMAFLGLRGHGTAKCAHRFFHGYWWTDVLEAAGDEKDDIIRHAVMLLREAKYSEFIEYMTEMRHALSREPRHHQRDQ